MQTENTSRIKRGWTLVALKGTVNMYKGQNIRSPDKDKDLNDELEQGFVIMITHYIKFANKLLG